MLSQFRLHEKLGEGADSEVFAATDTETGSSVVVKRPHPMLIARGQHGAVERRISKTVALRERLGERLPHITKLVAYTEPSNHDEYFGDALGERYTVTVEARAAGVPLVGSAMDGIKRHPIGAPQNLFAIHPIIPHKRRGRFSIVRDLLEVAAAFQAASALILDMRPQNIYFEPADATISVIDIGGITEERPADRGKPPLDLHDFYLELFKWYMPTSAPPAGKDGYRQPVGMETVPMFNQNLESMIRQHSQASEERWHSAAIDILHKVKARGYAEIQAFNDDFEALLALLEEQYAALLEDHSAKVAWREAKALLVSPYWNKFRFSSNSLATYE